MSDYQGLVTKWQKLSDEKDPSVEDNLDTEDFHVLLGASIAYKSCADELAEVIARNVQPSPEPDKDVANLLTNICQILDVVKLEWGAENCWSPWDQEQRDRATEYLRKHYAAQEARPVQPSPTNSFLCAARHSDTGANDPQDCDWPFCGCDQYADKVIEAIQESGFTLQAGARPVQQPATEPLRKTIRGIIENEPLGYRTEDEHAKLENFADRILAKIEAALALRDVPKGRTPEVTKLAKRVLHYLGAGLIDPKLADELRELARNVLPRPLESGPCANEKQTTNKGEIMTPEIIRLRAINLLAELSVPSDEPKIAIIESFMNDWREWDGRQVSRVLRKGEVNA